MSTRHIVAARNTSNAPAEMRAAASATPPDVRLKKNLKVIITMTIAAKADGSRLRNSVTSPPLSHPSKAMHQASIGGLYGMSAPKLTGRIQLPWLSIETATIASRGSPFVVNSVSDRNGIKVTMRSPARSRVSHRAARLSVTEAECGTIQVYVKN